MIYIIESKVGMNDNNQPASGFIYETQETSNNEKVEGLVTMF